MIVTNREGQPTSRTFHDWIQMADGSAQPKRRFVCSFCARVVEAQTRALIGNGAVICATCLERDRTGRIWSAGARAGAPGHAADDKELLAQLYKITKTQAQAAQMMRDQVALLRQRQVSWARIGRVLGVSRQAAWERFADSPRLVDAPPDYDC